jgi:hypothetical protein
MIQFTFDELGIDLAEFNGATVESVNAAVINRAADYFKSINNWDSELDEDIFLDYKWPVNLITREITIPDNSLIPNLVKYN